MSVRPFPSSDVSAHDVGLSALGQSWREDPIATSLFCGLIAGLAWAPFWLGGNRLIPWAINGIYFPALAALYEIALLARGRRHPVGLGEIALPAALFGVAVLWISVQISPTLGQAVAHPIWSMASDTLGLPVDSTISVNPGASAIGLVRLLTAAALFWLALQLSRHHLRAHLLLQAVSFIVAAYSAYGLVLTAFFQNVIPFFSNVNWSLHAVRSTFVNQNSFATYAGLGLLTTLALILRFYRHEVPHQEGLAAYRLGQFIEATGRRGAILLGLGCVILAALLGSASRGGALAAALGVFALLLLTFFRRRKGGLEQIEAIIFVTLALVAGLFYFGEALIGHIAGSGLADASRQAVYAIVLHSIADAPITGFGYGAFQDVFPMYRDQSIGNIEIWDKAHNTYLEVWQGLGVIFGTALIGALVGLAAKCFIGAHKRRRDASPATVGAAASLLIGVHALVDFSIQIEAVALTFLALLAAGVAQSRSTRYAVAD